MNARCEHPGETVPFRVVADTNVFVAAGFRPASGAARILNAVRRGDLRLVWNDATRDEVRRILRRISRRTPSFSMRPTGRPPRSLGLRERP